MPRLRRGRLLVGLIVVTLCSTYLLVARRLPRHANIETVQPDAPADEVVSQDRPRLSRLRLQQEIYLEGNRRRSEDHGREEWDRNIVVRSAASQKSGGEADQPLARKRTLTDLKSDRTAHKKSPGRFPITEHMYFMIERHMKEMMNKSLAVIKGFDKERYLAPQRIKNGERDPMMRHKFNQIASDSTPCNRPLQDYRHPSCWNKPVKAKLPKSTIIICFHNEARSALLRTIVSVLSRSPPDLIEEVLLVDDYSDNVMDGELLTVVPKVRLVRLQQRQGLIRARIAGVQAARGEILVFLDSHCEATTGWLEPLVARIVENEAHVVSPVIDIINKDSMIYTPANSNIKGGFTPHLTFRWEVLSKEEVLQRKDDPASPIHTPSIAGGLFAISKRYFEHLGVYDPGMEIWGGENVEMSLRVWMCGGVLEIIPCSRVGHIFRSSMPYGFGTGKTYHSTVTKNLRRLAEVWMGVYKEVFYRSTPIARTVPIGDISDRLELKEKLQCRSFKWFVENIYPEFKIPSEGSLIPRQLKQGRLCLQRNHSLSGFITVAPCDKIRHQASNQTWLYSEEGTLRYRNKCLTVKDDQFILSHCSNSVTYRKDQEYVTEPVGIRHFLLRHKARQSCVTVVNTTLALRTCSHDRLNQYWQFIT